jgi:hypothetical protein
MSEKDAWVKAYLEDVRRRNRLRMNTCYVCGKEAKWIVANKHEIRSACREHSDND